MRSPSLRLPGPGASVRATESCRRGSAPFLGRQRSLHTALPVSSLPFNVEDGLPPFLSPRTARLLAVDWQEGLLNRLNEHVAGTENEGKTLFDTIIELSKDRTQVAAFNIASEALNNSFFLNGLRPPKNSRSSHVPARNSALTREIDQTYGSLTQLISYFSSAAMGIFSSGYVWLTCDQSGLLGVCATYGGGTILVQNRQQRGDWGTLLVPPPASAQSKTSPTPMTESAPGASPTSARAFSTSARAGAAESSSLTEGEDRMVQGKDARAKETEGKGHGASFADALFDSSMPQAAPFTSRALNRPSNRQAYSSLYPLLGLQVAERAWMGDYGVWGKEEYVRNFWHCVNWSKVEAEFGRRKGTGTRFGRW